MWWKEVGCFRPIGRIPFDGRISNIKISLSPKRLDTLIDSPFTFLCISTEPINLFSRRHIINWLCIILIVFSFFSKKKKKMSRPQKPEKTMSSRLLTMKVRNLNIITGSYTIVS